MKINMFLGVLSGSTQGPHHGPNGGEMANAKCEHPRLRTRDTRAQANAKCQPAGAGRRPATRIHKLHVIVQHGAVIKLLHDQKEETKTYREKQKISQNEDSQRERDSVKWTKTFAQRTVWRRLIDHYCWPGQIYVC